MLTPSTLPSSPAERILLAKRDPWFFLEHCVFTLDQTDENQPIKRFPANDPNMRDYLRLYSRIWEQNKRIAVPKSRRMFMTWTNISLHLWLAMFGIGKSVAVISKKEDDSNELLKRMKFIYDNIPEEVLPKKLLPKMETVYGEIRFPEIESWIKGFAQGDGQLRQYTMTAILADEMAFWEQAEAAYSSAIPTLEGGGRFTAISSPAPGFFRRLVDDRLDQGKAEEVDTRDVKRPITGVEVWRNKINKFVIFQLHYHANQKKRDPAYIEEVRASMPRAQFMQEYELQWESFLGKPVYPDFEAMRHITHKPIYPEIGLPLLRGWDFGLTPACVVAQFVEGQLRILTEFTAENMGAEKFSDLVLAKLRILFPTWADQKRNWRDYIDPAGNQRQQSDESTCAQALVKRGLAPAPGPVAFEARRQSVERFLLRQTRDGPGLIIDASCKVLIDGFKGGYHYPEKASEIEPTKLRPVKNEYSHPHDALQYLCSGVMGLEKKRGVGIPAPAYKWNSGGEISRSEVPWQAR